MGGSRQKATRHSAGGQEGKRGKWGVVAALGLMLLSAPCVFAGDSKGGAAPAEAQEVAVARSGLAAAERKLERVRREWKEGTASALALMYAEQEYEAAKKVFDDVTGTAGAPVHVRMPEAGGVDLATLIALNRMEAAGKKLGKVQALAQQGKASEGELAAAEQELEEAARAVERAAERREGAGPKITVEIKDATLEDALRMMFKDTDQSVVVQSGIVVGSPVNLSLKNVPLEDAVKALTELYGLQYKRGGTVWLISQQPGMINVGGAHVPLLGAVPNISGDRVFERRVGDESETLLFLDPRIVRETGGGGGGNAWERRLVVGPSLPGEVEFPGSETLVDLDVKDAPLSEVAAKLSAAVNAALRKEAQRQVGFLEAADLVEIIAQESLASVRVTAKVHKWPAGQVLGMLADQTGTVCSQEKEGPPTPAEAAKQVGPGGGVVKLVKTTRIYLVPRPMLEVTGAGIAGKGGIGSGGGGGGGGLAPE